MGASVVSLWLTWGTFTFYRRTNNFLPTGNCFPAFPGGIITKCSRKVKGAERWERASEVFFLKVMSTVYFILRAEVSGIQIKMQFKVAII